MHDTTSLTRRDFLRRSGGLMFSAGALLAVPSLFLNRTSAQTGENPSELIRVGIIGSGNQGRAKTWSRRT
jgi:hypothetical protein